MPRNPKVFIHNTTVFLTTSVEEGIMFPPNALIRELMLSALAKAQALFPVEICDFLVSTTHVHFLIRVTDPSLIEGFMERFKTESAHSLNRILGRKKRTIWCEGYDSPILPTVEDVIKKKIYLYTNPSKDNLHPHIDSYPGLSSWSAFQMGKHQMRAYLTARNDYWELPQRQLSADDYRALARKLCLKKPKTSLILSPDSWMKCFRIVEPRAQKEINDQIRDGIREHEKENHERRNSEGRSCISYTSLINTPIGKPFQPNRTGRRMLVHCYDKQIRRSIIRWLKEIIADGREVYARWLAGDISARYPAGLYPPSLPKHSDILINQLA